MDLGNRSVPDPTEQNRRQFLRRTSVASAAAVAGLSGQGRGQESTEMTDSGGFESDPFSLGVASGDPLPDSVILWTRLAPDPLTVGGGMPRDPVAVDWTVAADRRLQTVVESGTVTAQPDNAHAVHVEASGLDPSTEYYYQFEAGGEQSPVGRTKTAPAPGSTPSEFQFAFVSCQDWPSGFYTAHRYMAADELDLILHLGDYIYESGIGANGGARETPVPQVYRTEADSLERYRLQYGLYKSDPDLRAAHASAPWLVTPDDHEVDNNRAGGVPQDPEKQDPEAFLQRRAEAFRAYYEHMPLRPPQKPTGPDQKLYRNYSFGDLVEFNVLDTRQYRSDQACGDGQFVSGCEQRFDEDRTILGDTQRAWLVDNLDRSVATWDVLANQVKFSRIDFAPGPSEAFTMDQWDGYVADQQRVKRAFEDHAENPVVVTGDIHFNLATEIRAADDPSRTVGAEFVGTSVSSRGDGADFPPLAETVFPENENLSYFNDKRGYTRCTVTPDEWTTEYRVLDYVSEPRSPVRTDATFTVRAGRPGLRDRRPTVAVRSLTVGTGGTARTPLLARWLSAGVAGGRVRLSVADPGVATITGATVADTFGTGRATVADDGSSATVEFADPGGTVQAAAGGVDIPIAFLDIHGDRASTTALEPTVERFTDDTGNTPETATRSGAVVVTDGPPAVAGGNPPTDPDDDGQYEDVDGDGRLDDDDVTALFDAFDSDSVRSNGLAYDFNNNGRLDFDDIVTLQSDLD